MICPFCNCKTNDINHVIIDHEQFWKSRALDPTTFPKTVEEFNSRFGLLGLTILEEHDEN